MALHRLEDANPATCLAGPPRNRRKFWLIAIPVLAVLLIGGVAFAAVLLRMPFKGGGNSGQVVLNWMGNPTATGACTVTGGGAGALTISFTDVLPGDSCRIAGAVNYNLSRHVKVQPPKFITSPGISLDFASDSTLQAGQDLFGQQTNVPTFLTLTFGQDLPLGQTFTADADAGIVAQEVPAP